MLTLTLPPRNPIAGFAYLGPAIMSPLYLAGVTEAGKITTASSVLGAWFWTSLLGMGGLIGLIGFLRFPKLKDKTALLVESTGALLLATMLAIYVIVLLATNEPRPARPPVGRFPGAPAMSWVDTLPWYTIVVTACLTAGFGFRAVQAMVHRGQLLTVTAAVKLVAS